MARHRAPAPAAHQMAWAVTGTLALGLMQWIVIAILARQGGPGWVGAYALALGIAAPVFTFSMLQLRLLLVTERDPAAVRGSYLALRLCTSVAAFVLVASCAGFLTGTTAVLLLAVGLARFSETVGDLLLGCIQGAGRVDRVGQNQTLLAVASTGLFGGALAVTGDVRVAAWALPTASFLIALVLPWLHVRSSLQSSERMITRGDFAPGSLLAVGRAGLPLGGSSSVSALAAAVPRFALQGYHGSATLGVYSAVSQMSQALSSLAGAISQARLPILARRFHHDEGSSRIASASLVAVGTCTSAGLVIALPAYVWGPQLVRALYGDAFVVSPLVMALFAVATGLVSCGWFLDQALVTERRTNAQLAVNVLVLVVVTAGCLVLGPRQGLLGVATAFTLGAGVQCVAKTLLVVLTGRPRDLRG